jgi:predicted outer membrane repeat protein
MNNDTPASAILGSVMALVLSWCAGVHADTLVSSEAQLNAAIAEYNALNSGSLAVQITGNISLSAPLTPISNGSANRPELRLSGSGGVLRVLDGASAHQILDIGGFSRVRLEQLRFANGRDTVGEGRGGAIQIGRDAVVTIVDCEFDGNSAPGDPAAPFADSGGAISVSGVLFVATSTFVGNTAVNDGGAISVADSGDLTVVASTFTDNAVTSGNFGGAVNVGSRASADVSQSTFSGNRVRAATSPALDGLENDGGTLTIRSNIFADGCSSSTSGMLTNDGDNLFESDSVSRACGATDGVNGDIVGRSAELLPLADNGGLTRTMAIAPTSPAIDTGSVDLINRSDQRGVPRGSLPPDIGAFEFVGADAFDNVARNDAIDAPTTLSNGLYEGLTIDDVADPADRDHYAVALTAGEAFTATIRFSHRLEDIDLRLYRPDGSIVASSVSVTDDEAISYTPSGDAQYVLAVFPYSDSPGSLFYDLEVSGIAVTPEDDGLCIPLRTSGGGIAIICL